MIFYYITNFCLITGTRQVLVGVGSKSATTHSYMIMPYLDMGGGVGKLLYLKSSEPGGNWPVRMAVPQGSVYFKVTF